MGQAIKDQKAACQRNREDYPEVTASRLAALRLRHCQCRLRAATEHKAAGLVPRIADHGHLRLCDNARDHEDQNQITCRSPRPSVGQSVTSQYDDSETRPGPPPWLWPTSVRQPTGLARLAGRPCGAATGPG